MTLYRKHILISGRVQGVNFRYSLRQTAIQLGVVGWCRNLKDGKVEAAFYGTHEALEQLVEWCHDGPPMAEVTQVDVEDLPIEGLHVPNIFEIRT